MLHYYIANIMKLKLASFLQRILISSENAGEGRRRKKTYCKVAFL
jgi:hypothetical protein